MCEVVHVPTCLYVSVTQRKESFYSRGENVPRFHKVGEVTGNGLNKVKG